MRRMLVTRISGCILAALALGGCEFIPFGVGPESPFSDEDNWLAGFSVENAGNVVVENVDEEAVAVFAGSISSDNLVGVVEAGEADYRLERLDVGMTVLNIVRVSELEEHLDEPQKAQGVAQEVVYVTGDEEQGRQKIEISSAEGGNAELHVKNELEHHVEVREESAGGSVLFVMAPQEESVRRFPDGTQIVLFPVELVPVVRGDEIVGIEYRELSEAADQFALTEGEPVEYVIQEQEGRLFSGYLFLRNEYGSGVELVDGDTVLETTLGYSIVNPDSTAEYAFEIADDETKELRNLTIEPYGDSFEVADIDLQQGEVVEIVLDEAGNVNVHDPVPYDQKVVQEDTEALEIGFADEDDKDSVTDDLELPTSGPQGSSVHWESSDDDHIEPDNAGTGHVTRPDRWDPDVEVTLTATLTRRDAEGTREFEVTVSSY